MRSHRLRTILVVVPPLLALFSLVGLYLARWSLIGSVAKDGIESAFERAIGGGIDLEIASLGGTVLTGVRLHDLTTGRAAADGVVRALSVEELRLDYATAEMLGFVAAAAFRSWPKRTDSYDVSWIGGRSPLATRIAENLFRTLPESLSGVVRGSVALRADVQEGPIDYELRREPSEDSSVFRVLLSGIEAPFGFPGDSVALSVYASPGIAGVRTERSGTSPGLEGDAVLVADDGSLESASMAFEVGRFTGTALARADGAVFRVGSSDSLGKLEGSATIDAAAGLSVVEELFTSPIVLLRSSQVSVGAAANGLQTHSLSLDRLRLDATWRNGVLDVENAALSIEAVRKEAEGDSPAFAASMSGALTLADGDSVLERLSGDLEVRFVLNDPDLVWAAAAALGAAKPLPDGVALGSSVAVDVSLEDGGDGAAEITAAAAIDGPSVAGIALDAVSVRARLSTGSVSAPDKPERRGGPDGGPADGSASVGPAGSVAGVGAFTVPVEIQSLAVEKGPSSVRGSGRVRLRIGSANPLRVYTASLQTEDLSAFVPPIGASGIVLRGTSDELTVEEARATLAREYVRSPDGSQQAVELVLSEPTAVRWGDGRLSVEPFVVESGVGVVRGALDITGEDTVSADMQADRMPLSFLLAFVDRSLAARADGAVTITADASGPLSLPTVRLEVAGEDMQIDGEAAAMVVSARQEGREITFSDVLISLPSLLEVRADGSAPFGVGAQGLVRGAPTKRRLEVTAEVPRLSTLLGESAASALVRHGAETAGLEAGISVRSNRLSASASVGPIEPAGEPRIVGTEPFTDFVLSWSADIADGRLPFTARLSSGSDTLAEASGALQGPALLEAPARPADFTIDGTVTAEVPLMRVSHIVPGASLYGGTARAMVEVSGSVPAPELSGRLTIRDGIAKVAPSVPSISDISGTIRLSDGEFTTEDLSGSAGGESFAIAGTVDTSGNGQMELSGSNLLVFRTEDLSVRGDVEAALRLEPTASSLTGRLRATDVRYSRPVELFSFGTSAARPAEDVQLFRIPGEWARNLALDVRIVGRETLSVENNLYDGRLSADLRLSGTAAVPRPSGRIFGESGTVRLPTTALAVQQVEVLFPADAAFRPVVFLQAETTIRRYDMSVTADGRMPDVEVQIVSSPALPTDEALVLLTTGRLPGELDFTADASGAVTAVGTVLGRSLYDEIAESLPEDGRRFLDRLDFEIEQAEGVLGDVEVEYQLTDGRRWYLLFNRMEEEDYSVQLAWRLWMD